MCAMKEARLLPNEDVRQDARMMEKVGFQATIYDEDCFSCYMYEACLPFLHLLKMWNCL